LPPKKELRKDEKKSDVERGTPEGQTSGKEGLLYACFSRGGGALYTLLQKFNLKRSLTFKTFTGKQRQGGTKRGIEMERESTHTVQVYVWGVRVMCRHLFEWSHVHIQIQQRGIS